MFEITVIICVCYEVMCYIESDNIYHKILQIVNFVDYYKNHLCSLKYVSIWSTSFSFISNFTFKL